MTFPSTQPMASEAPKSPSAEAAALPSRWKIWLQAARPKTLPAAAGPVLFGTALAHAAGRLALLPAAAALMGALLIQIGTNLANDLFDFQSGADGDDRLGPLRVTQAGWLSPREVAWGTAVSFSLAVAVGLYLVYVGGWPIVVVGVLAIICGLAYTGGPFPLGYRGLGDLFVLVFFGPVAVAGTYYVQALEINAQVVLAGLPLGLLSTAILAVNNLRDRHSDARAGKKTLVVRLGERAGRTQHILCVVLAYGLVVLSWATGYGSTTSLLVLVSLPLALRTVLAVRRADGAALNAQLAATAQLGLVFAMLWSLGVVL